MGKSSHGLFFCVLIYFKKGVVGLANIINAIINIVNNPVYELKEVYVDIKNRVNSVGDALETYIVDVFSGTYNDTEQKRLIKISETFSYLGNASNPPDAILKQGDAIEVKKISGIGKPLQLNSSYPKHKLLNNSGMITKACRECEDNLGGWVEKDIIYVVGVVNKGKLINLTMVYGEDYAANIELYEEFKTNLRNNISNIEGLDFSLTKELGRLNNIDPLGITSLRIRPMFIIQNPKMVYNYLGVELQGDFNLQVIINKKKWDTFDNSKELEDLEQNTGQLTIKDVKIKDTNNPALLKDAKLITYSYTTEE